MPKIKYLGWQEDKDGNIIEPKEEQVTDQPEIAPLDLSYLAEPFKKIINEEKMKDIRAEAYESM